MAPNVGAAPNVGVVDWPQPNRFPKLAKGFEEGYAGAVLGRNAGAYGSKEPVPAGIPDGCGTYPFAGNNPFCGGLPSQGLLWYGNCAIG